MKYCKAVLLVHALALLFVLEEAALAGGGDRIETPYCRYGSRDSCEPISVNLVRCEYVNSGQTRRFSNYTLDWPKGFRGDISRVGLAYVDLSRARKSGKGTYSVELFHYFEGKTDEGNTRRVDFAVLSFVEVLPSPPGFARIRIEYMPAMTAEKIAQDNLTYKEVAKSAADVTIQFPVKNNNGLDLALVSYDGETYNCSASASQSVDNSLPIHQILRPASSDVEDPDPNYLRFSELAKGKYKIEYEIGRGLIWWGVPSVAFSDGYPFKYVTKR